MEHRAVRCAAINSADASFVRAVLTDPSLGDRIEVIAMAFDGWPDGHDGFNVRNDVTAWQAILDSIAKITCGDAVSTIRHLALSVEQANQLFGEYGELGAVPGEDPG